MVGLVIGACQALSKNAPFNTNLSDESVSFHHFSGDNTIDELLNLIKETKEKKVILIDRMEYLFNTEGFDKTINEADEEGIGTFIVFQKSQGSGIIIHAGSMNWCSYTGMNGKDWLKIRKITRNMMDKMISGSSVFSQ